MKLSVNFDRNRFVDRSKPAANMGLKEMAGEVLNQTFVLLIKCSACRQFTAPKPPLL